MESLPDDVLLHIDTLARKDSKEPQEDLWMMMTHYEHRLRNQRTVNQFILSQVHLTNLEYFNVLDRLRGIPGLSVYARREMDGSVTIQCLSVGYTTHSSLFTGTRFTYSIVHDHTNHVVEEVRQAPLARFFDGEMITMLSPPGVLKRGNWSGPTVRVYEVRISGRRVPGSAALLGTNRRFRKLCTRYWFPPLSRRPA